MAQGQKRREKERLRCARAPRNAGWNEARTLTSIHEEHPTAVSLQVRLWPRNLAAPKPNQGTPESTATVILAAGKNPRGTEENRVKSRQIQVAPWA